MRHFVFVAIFLITGAVPSAWAEDIAVDLQLVLAVDASGSVDDDEYGLQLAGIAAGLRDDKVLLAIQSGPHARIAINLMIWAEARLPKDHSGWMLISSAEEAERAASVIERFPRRLTGGTGLGDGIAHALRSISGNGYHSQRQIVDVSGDGRETSPRWYSVILPEARGMAIARGVTINGLAIENDDPELGDYYRRQMQIGDDSFVLRAASYLDFAEAMRRKLLREIEYLPKLSRR